MINAVLEPILAIICFVLVLIIMHAMVRCGVHEIIEAVKPVEDEDICDVEQ